MQHIQGQSGQANHWLLMVAIVIGIITGSLVSSWLVTHSSNRQLQQSVSILNEQLASLQVENTQKNILSIKESLHQQAQQRERIRELRASSHVGLALQKDCSKLKTANLHYKNVNSRTHLRKACDRYEKYLGTGIAPVEGLN